MQEVHQGSAPGAPEQDPLNKNQLNEWSEPGKPASDLATANTNGVHYADAKTRKRRAPKAAPDTLPGFDAFWEAYPRKVDKQDALKAWAKLRGQLFVPLEHDIQRATTRVLEYAERMVGMGKGRNGADPFVIALAVARDGVVVTEEYKGSLASPKIPVVCEALGVRCMTTVEFIQDQGWTF